MKRVLLVLVCIFCVFFMSARDVRYVFLGDSNTWSGGMKCSNKNSWTYWFMQQMQPAECTNFARSGATWTHTAQTLRMPHDSTAVLSDQNVVFNQAIRLIEQVQLKLLSEPDVIIIFAGTNDAWFSEKRPGIWDMDVESAFDISSDKLLGLEPNQVKSMALAVRYTTETLQRAFPLAQIVLVTPPQTTKTSNEQIQRVAEIIDGCGLAIQLPVVHLESDRFISREQELEAFTLTRDGVHTNSQGARKIGQKIASIITHYGIR